MFSSKFSNITHDLEPIDVRNMEEEANKGYWNFLMIFARKHKKMLIIYQALCLTWSLQATLWPIILMEFVGALESIKDPQTENIMGILAWPIIFGASVWLLLEVLFRLMFFVQGRYVQPDIEYDISHSVASYLLYKPYSFFLANHSGMIAGRISQMYIAVFDIVSSVASVCLPAFLGTVIMIGGFFMINKILGLIALIYCISHFVILKISIKECVEKSMINSEAFHSVTAKILDIICNINSVKSFARLKHERVVLATTQNAAREATKTALLASERMKIKFSINSFLLAGVVFFTAQIILYKQGELSIADMSYCLSNMLGLVYLAWWSSEELLQLIEAMGDCKDAIEFFFGSGKIKENIETTDTACDLIKRGRIEFKSVYFAYNADSAYFFEKQSIVIKAKEKVGLVGLSGSGKSTFINLLMGFFPVNKGKILIDKTDISTLSGEDLRQHISLIPQDCMLFDRTVLQNIAYGDINATHDEIIEASKKANAHKFITEMDNGYSTMISEKGSRLSGGQRQRIAIARAILKDAPILILDEATSALDKHTESLIQVTINEIMKKKTVLAIAHRLETLQNMDRILVFDDGGIIESGTHAELIADKASHYYYMWQLQIK